MAYVPPALRRKQEGEKAAVGGVAPKPLNEDILPGRCRPSAKDIRDHFWPLAQDPSIASVGNDDANDAYKTSQPHSTLNGTAESPDALRFILVFADAVRITPEFANLN